VTLLLLAHVVLFAFLAETVLGFGATVLAVTFGAHLYPIGELLPALVPVNLAVSIYILARYHEAIDRRLLLRRILPFMGLGLPAGLLVFNLQDNQLLKIVFAAFVVVLSSAELVRHLRRAREARPLPPLGGAALLVAGGFIHGVYGSGGPMVVYVASREIADKGRFRSTLSALWLLLNLVLLGNYVFTGALDGGTLKMSAALLLPVTLAVAAGEWIHGRVAARAFRIAVTALLLFAGIALLLSGIP
jgi:hypothetical protein